MYELLAYVRKLDKIAVQFAITLNIMPCSSIEEIKKGMPLREEYNVIFNDMKEEFSSYYLPVLDKLSMDKDKLTSKKNKLFYFNNLIVAFAGYMGFRSITPYNIFLFAFSATGFIVNVILNSKLNNIIASKNNILENYKVILSTMNKSDVIIEEYIKEVEKNSSVAIIENSKENENNYEYNPLREKDNIEYNQEKSSIHVNLKVKKRIKKDGDK